MIERAVVLALCLSPVLGQEPVTQKEGGGAVGNVQGPASAQDLPRAEPGRWKGWSPGPSPLESVAGDYIAAAQDLGRGWVRRSSERAYDVLRREPDYPPALLLAGAACFRLQRYGDAIELYERFLFHAPSELAKTRQLGHSLHSMGRSQEALEHYDRLLDADPADFLVLRARGVVRVRTGDLDGALADLAAVLKEHAGDAEALYWRASVLFDDEREGALAAAREARDAAPFTARTWFLLAQAAGEAGEDGEAEVAKARHAELTKAEAAMRVLEGRLLEEPDDLEALEKLAQLHLAVGDFRGARSGFFRLMRWAEEAGDAEVAARAKRGYDAQATLGR